MNRNLNIRKNEINNFILKDNFLQFLVIHSITGENVARVISDALKYLGINCDYMSRL